MIGLDIGTFNLVCCRRGEKNEIKNRKEVNCFIELPLENPFMFNMLHQAKVKLIKREKVAYLVGQRALDLAYTLPAVKVRRPMKDGCLNPSEKDAFEILKIIIHSLIGEVEKDKEIVFFSVPANAVNEKTNAEYHQKVLEAILQSYNVNNKTLDPHPINEGLALVFAELAEKNYTGIGISFGAGQVNLCYSVLSTPVFKMSLVDSGDWIDENAARACGETTSVINKEKTKIDLNKTPTTMIERAVQGQYHILIEKTFSAIKKAILDAGNAVRTEVPLDIVVSGGVASPPGFVEIVREVVKSLDYPIPIGEIIKPEDNLFSVGRGCLIAAENSQI